MKRGRNRPRRRMPTGEKLTERIRTDVTPATAQRVEDVAHATGISEAAVLRDAIQLYLSTIDAGQLPVVDGARFREIILAAQRQAVAASVELARTAEALGLIAHAAGWELADSGPLKAG